MATVDARAIIARGGEPFEAIMAAVMALGEGEELVVMAPFEPVPLQGLLCSQGFDYQPEEMGGGDWRVTFRRPSPEQPHRSPAGGWPWPPSGRRSNP